MTDTNTPYMDRDNAKRYKRTFSNASSLIDDKVLYSYLKTISENGYVVINDVLDEASLDAIRSESLRLLEHKGRNEFEGHLTQRIYSVIAKSLVCNPLVDHPLIMALLENTLLPGFLLSQLQMINILPGESQQPLHADDGFYQVPRPRSALSAATVWAIDDFTSENGGTAVIPRSHLWDAKEPTSEDKQRQINVEMKAGSVVFFLGTLWHGGGANNSVDKSRLGITAQYCEPWCRQQENFSLSVPPARVAQCSDEIKHMLGYSVYGPFMGFVDGKHPKRLLEDFDQK